MFEPLARWLCLIALLAGLESAHGHSGYENETDVRIFADRMQVNVRATFGFAWRILGNRAPNGIDEAAQKTAGPLLAAEGPGLFEVTAGGMPLTPRSHDCVFELDQHVMFRLVYDRPPAWPLVLKARFFDLFDPLTYGTVRVFDQTDAPYVHDVEPLAECRIHRSSPTFIHDPSLVGEVAAEVSPSVPAPQPEKPKPRGLRGYLVAALLFGLFWLGRTLLSKRPGA